MTELASGRGVAELEERLQGFVGREVVTLVATDPVNVAMVRHWVEAMGDTNPIYLDADAARATGRPSVVAPPTMLQAWTMPGYAATVGNRTRTTSPMVELHALLTEAGYTSIVATDSDQEYLRELVPGDMIRCTETIEAVSPEKQTRLGSGRFITSVKAYHDEHGAVVGIQRWRLFRFRPPQRRPAGPSGAEPTGSPALRPRPAVNRDNAFWFDACREHRLLVQRCADCAALRHPPGPCCPRCRSFRWDTVQASGRGRLYSYVVSHHPQVPGFDYPLVVALVELEEGVRLVANTTAVAPHDLAIGMPLVLDWVDADPELSLPAFRPAGGEG